MPSFVHRLNPHWLLSQSFGRCMFEYDLYYFSYREKRNKDLQKIDRNPDSKIQLNLRYGLIKQTPIRLWHNPILHETEI